MILRGAEKYSTALPKGMDIMKNDKGFSLIELIIVVAIMAVLVAVIAPNLTKYLSASKKRADEFNMNTIEGALGKACGMAGVMVSPPDSSQDGVWVILKEDSAYFDSDAPNIGGVQAFSKFVAEELSNKVPKSKQTGNPFKVRITQSASDRYNIEVETQ